MKKWFAGLAAVMLLSSLTACERAVLEATTKLEPGKHTGYDVRDVYGPPTEERKEADGSTTWVYVRGPMGFTTLMINIGADNKLRSIEQVLSDSYFAKVQPGMTKEEVNRLLGRPAEKVVFDLKKEEVWSWNYKETGDVRMQFNAHFDLDGKVVSKSKSQVMTGR